MPEYSIGLATYALISKRDKLVPQYIKPALLNLAWLHNRMDGYCLRVWAYPAPHVITVERLYDGPMRFEELPYVLGGLCNDRWIAYWLSEAGEVVRSVIRFGIPERFLTWEDETQTGYLPDAKG